MIDLYRVQRLPIGGKLAALAAVAALGVLLVGSGTGGGWVDVQQLARTVQAEEDHVSALQLARWIRNRRPGLHVVDLRSPEEYAAYHIPTALQLSLPDLPDAGLRHQDTIVLYSEGGTHAAQAWFLMRAMGYRHVLFLREGLYEWLDQVMEPTLPRAARPADRRRFQEAAALSRYFGGLPHTGTTPDTTRPGLQRSAALPLPPAHGQSRGTTPARAIRRRGC